MGQAQSHGAGSNRVIQLVREAKSRDWCVKPFCTTCGNRDFRQALKTVPDLTTELVGLDIDDLGRIPCGVDCLTIIMQTQDVEWDSILATWMPRVADNVRLADAVLFRVIGRLMPFQRTQTMQNWIQSCIELACKTKDTSLVESLVYVIGVRGEGIEERPDFLAVARDVGEHDDRVRRALAKAGLTLGG